MADIETLKVANPAFYELVVIISNFEKLEYS